MHYQLLAFMLVIIVNETKPAITVGQNIFFTDIGNGLLILLSKFQNERKVQFYISVLRRIMIEQVGFLTREIISLYGN